MIIRADILITMLGDPIPHGAVEIDPHNGTIISVDTSPKDSEITLDLPGHILLPGFINAHCHLDYTALRGFIPPGLPFADWIREINDLKQQLTPDDTLESIAQGFQLLAESGCTTVFNIESFPSLLQRMPPPPLRTWWFLELIDVKTPIRDASSLYEMLRIIGQKKDWIGGFGLSPHAPYTASLPLYRLATEYCQHHNLPLTTHIAESFQEQNMFLNASGALFDLLHRLGRPMTDCGQHSPLAHLLQSSILPPGALAVHLNYLQDSDWPLLQKDPPHIVHCPKCHAYFGHTPFQLEKFLGHGCTVSLGTDSLASNNTLDLRAEIREARQHHPTIRSRQWLEMITTTPAAAIGQEGRLGCISPGAYADLIAIPFSTPNLSDPYETIIQSTEKPNLFLINGKQIS